MVKDGNKKHINHYIDNKKQIIHKNRENNDKNYKNKKEMYNDDEYEINSFIDDNDVDFQDNEDYHELLKFHKEMKHGADIRKKKESKGDIPEADYQTIQDEEEITRRIGRKVDAEELERNRKLKEIEGDDEEDEEDY